MNFQDSLVSNICKNEMISDNFIYLFIYLLNVYYGYLQ